MEQENCIAINQPCKKWLGDEAEIALMPDLLFPVSRNTLA
jgi:hypothetical protein